MAGTTDTPGDKLRRSAMFIAGEPKNIGLQPRRGGMWLLGACHAAPTGLKTVVGVRVGFPQTGLLADGFVVTMRSEKITWGGQSKRIHVSIEAVRAGERGCGSATETMLLG